MEALHIHYSVQETECSKLSRDLWVIAQHELTFDYGGSDRSPLHFLLLCPHPYMSSLPPSVHVRRQTGTTENPRSRHSCGVVRRPLMGVLCGCGQHDRRSVLSCVTAALDHRQPWLLKKGFPPVLRPSWDCCGIYEESKARNAAGGGEGRLGGWLTCR